MLKNKSGSKSASGEGCVVPRNDIEDVRDELIEWGHWSRSGLGLSLHTASVNTLDPNITDDRALEIDRVIAILSLRDPVTAKILKSAFIQRLSIRDIAVEYQMNKTKANEYLKMGIGCVAMGLDVRAANDDKF